MEFLSFIVVTVFCAAVVIILGYLIVKRIEDMQNEQFEKRDN